MTNTVISEKFNLYRNDAPFAYSLMQKNNSIVHYDVTRKAENQSTFVHLSKSMQSVATKGFILTIGLIEKAFRRTVVLIEKGLNQTSELIQKGIDKVITKEQQENIKNKFISSSNYVLDKAVSTIHSTKEATAKFYQTNLSPLFASKKS